MATPNISPNMVEVLKFYMDRGLIPRTMPNAATMKKLAATYSKMASAPTGLDEVLSELNRAGLTPRDVLPHGTGKTAGRTPKLVKQMAEILSDARAAKASAVAPELLASMANESMLPVKVAQDMIGKGTAPFYPPAIVKPKISGAEAMDNLYGRLMQTRANRTALRGKVQARNAPPPIPRGAIDDVASAAQAIPDVIDDAASAAKAATKPTLAQEFKGLFSKEGAKKLAKGAWNNKGKIGLGVAGAALLANYLMGDGEEPAQPEQKFSLPEDVTPQVTDSVSVSQAAPAPQQTQAPAPRPTVSELALALQGIAETARSLGLEAQGGRAAVRKAANAKAPKLRF